ncbi:malate synthase A [Thioalkalivibrio denitrificans]|uniref:Malate synthase n=1 Tax=Thioalkalivibrio denitrificans TaxID=108003 RepID=A0A1V3NF76_9GAMM|nr:malate synthase A [Thioalkalivibrio denitrificans]OOG23721.1 malate synthase A [Thioalkalivibrio denitrificans]
MATYHDSVAFKGPIEGFEDLLTPDAVDFLVALHERFAARVEDVLDARRQRQARFDAGELPDFLPETREIRESDWTVAKIPEDLLDRRVEITGPTDRKMLINALNSGAKCFMACLEDAHSPTWHNCLEGQVNLRDAVNRNIDFTSPEGKEYRLNDETAVLIVRPRGWHLPEKHMTVGGRPIPGALFDFGLYFFHNARNLIDQGTGPYFYLPKLQAHAEARLWNDVFVFAQERLGIPVGTIKVTVLIETLPAVFELDEILWELKDHIVGLNCGRWDYIFSYIKTFRKHPDRILPDRGQVGMTVPFMRTYSLLVIKTCHRRGAFAMGGMAAQIPVRGDDEANREAFDKVRADKEREAKDGHDGTWVAHPGLVPVAMEVFDKHMPDANQVARQRPDVSAERDALIAPAEGTITEAGLRNNINVAIQYMAAWLGGRGAVPIHNLMEDAATAEISRCQIWQWIRHPGGVLDDGRRVTLEMVEKLIPEEMETIRKEVGSDAFESGHYQLAAKLFEDITKAEELADFLTLVAYEHLD